MTSDEQGKVIDDLGEAIGFFASTVDARRIVACVNSCAGLPTEELEAYKAEHLNDFFKIIAFGMERKEAVRQRDFAIDVIKHLVDEAKLTSAQYELCRQAIVTAEGGA